MMIFGSIHLRNYKFFYVSPKIQDVMKLCEKIIDIFNENCKESFKLNAMIYNDFQLSSILKLEQI